MRQTVPLLTAAEMVCLSEITHFGVKCESIDTSDMSPADAEVVERAVKAGDVSADRIALANLRLCGSTLGKYYKGQQSDVLATLQQEGFLSLRKAARLFEPSRQNQFSTYAVYWLRQGLAAEKQRTTMKSPYGDNKAHVVSLDSPAYASEDASDSLADVISDEENDGEAVAGVLMEQMTAQQILDHLPYMEREVVRLYFFRPREDGQKRSFRDVGAELDCSGEAARRLHKLAIERLKDLFLNNKEAIYA